MTGTRQTNPAVDLHDLPRIDLICLSHYHAYGPLPLLVLLFGILAAASGLTCMSDHFDQDVEASLRRDLPIITTPHAKSHLSTKAGEGEAFTAVTDLDAFESAIVHLTGAVDVATPLSHKTAAAIKVTGMPGKVASQSPPSSQSSDTVCSMCLQAFSAP